MQSRKGWTNCQFGMLSLHALVDALVEGYQIQYVYRTLKVLKTTSFYCHNAHQCQCDMMLVCSGPLCAGCSFSS